VEHFSRIIDKLLKEKQIGILILVMYYEEMSFNGGGETYTLGVQCCLSRIINSNYLFTIRRNRVTHTTTFILYVMMNYLLLVKY